MISLQNRPSGTSPQAQALRLLTEREMPRVHECWPKLSNFRRLHRLHMADGRLRPPFEGDICRGENCFFVHRDKIDDCQRVGLSSPAKSLFARAKLRIAHK